MDNGHDNDATQAGASNSTQQFSATPSQPQQSPENLAQPNFSQPSTPQPSEQPTTPQGIFSTADLSVNSENLADLKPELSEENKSRIASAFAQTDATQKQDQLSEQMAEQDVISGTVLPAGSMGSNATSSTAKGDIRLPGTKKKSKLPLVLAALAVVAAVGGATYFILNRATDTEENVGAIGAVNTSIIFDQTAPIPALFGNSYGYINPDDGSQVISARFLSAERFYGEYAVVKNGTDGMIENTSIIKRSGEIAFSLDGDVTAYYDIENNLWVIDGDTYDTDMQKLSPADTKGEYIGNGYLLVLSETNASEPTDDSDDTGTDDGESSRPSNDDGGTQGSSSAALGSIYNLDGKKVYDCNAYCSAFTFKVDNKIYGIVRVWGRSSQIVSLSNGETIYQAAQGVISLQDGELVERNGNSNTFLKIQNGQVVKSVQPEAALPTVSHASEYVVESCNESNKYTIKSTDGRVVSNCDIDNYYELPTNLYLAYRNKFKKAPILIVKNNELQLLNMNDAQVIRTYRGQDAMLFEDSPFLYMQNLMNNESNICNLLSEGDDACKSLGNESQTVEGYGNYFTISGGMTEHIYNAELKEIR